MRKERSDVDERRRYTTRGEQCSKGNEKRDKVT